VYLPERRYRAYRVGSASAAVASLAPPGCRSFYVEFSARSPLPADEVEPEAVETLLDLGLVGSRSDVLFAFTRVIPDAYAIHDDAWAPSRQAILGWLAARDILAAGRSGRWEYSSMEDALLAGRDSARKLA
jgi:hypothetical protein